MALDLDVAALRAETHIDQPLKLFIETIMEWIRERRPLDAITTAKATFNNCNSSAWKEDLLAINGYDERMKYGGPDRELGERLENHGVRGKQVRHRAVCLHLDHARGYKTTASVQANLAIRAETRSRKTVWTPHGIKKAKEPPSDSMATRMGPRGRLGSWAEAETASAAAIPR